MAQPVKRVIQDAHPDLIHGEPFRTLLIDGNALLFHAMADDKVNEDGIHYGGIFQFLLQMRMLLSKGEFEYVYCFFDSEYSGWQRWKLYHYYKANRDKRYENYGVSDYMKAYNDNLKKMQKAIFAKNKGKEYTEKKKSDWENFIDQNFDRERDILMEYFEEMFVRCYMDEITEADDQIAYYCLHKKEEEKIIIATGDMDLTQLLSDDIAIYNLDLKKFITTSNFKQYFGYYWENTLVKKIFTGDQSDNISNIAGLSEEGFFKLIPEARDRLVTMDEVKERAQKLIDERISQKKKPLKVHENIVNGVSNKDYDGDFYEINEKIINLKKPMMSEESIEAMESMMYAPLDPEGRSYKNLYKMILRDKIEDLYGDTKFASFFSVFKKIEEKEKKRFEKSVQQEKK